MSTPVIEDICVTTVLVPVTPPHRTASGMVGQSPLLLVDLHCGAGLTGHGMLFTYMPTALKPVGDLLLGLKELIVGQPLAPLKLYDQLQARCRLIGPQGLMGMALAGIDMAAWDALAREQSVSLNRLLGATTGQVNAYAGVGYEGELGTAQQAEAWVKQGYSSVKAKIGYPTANEDLRVIRAMRAAVGPDIEIKVDYNQCLDPVEAIRRIRLLENAELTWVEEPVLAHDYAGSAQVSKAVNTPVQSGENWWGPTDMQHALDAEASDFVMPDVMKIGGVSGWIKAVALAESRGKRVSSHLWPELSAQLLAAGRTTHWLEYIDWWAPVLEEPLQVSDGRVVFNDALVGSGVSWNASAVQQYRC